MSNTKKGFAQLEEISDATKQALSVSSLSNTPNKPQYGTPALSAQELKARFDALADKLIDRWNMLVRILNDGDVDNPAPLASIIPLSGEGIPSEITNVKQLAEAIQDGTLYAMIEDNNEITLATIISNIEVAINSHKSRLDNLDNANEWDYVIDKAEDFTTGNLATMSGNVLVKGFSVSDETLIDVRIGENIKLIKFDNVEMFASLDADGHTKIVGFVGLLHDYQEIRYSSLRGFVGVEFCSGAIDLSFCSNVIHCKIHTATDCFNLLDIDVIDYFPAGDHSSFVRCNVLNNIKLTPNESSGIAYAEFLNCNYISNVFNYSSGPGEKVTIDYNNCHFVVGDSCDGYFTSVDFGKVPVITEDGSKATKDVYSKDETYSGEEINSKIGTLRGNTTTDLATVESIAKGANQAKSFPNYKFLIDHLNSASEDLYKTGQNLYIQTREVPDLWVSGVSSEYVQYEYSSAGTVDKEFLDDLQNDNVVRVGHYRISALETQKVDLTEYLKKPTADKNYSVVPYVKPDGTEGRDTLSNNPIVNAIVKRTPNRQIRLPNQLDTEPLEDEAISRRYFEANKGGGGSGNRVALCSVHVDGIADGCSLLFTVELPDLGTPILANGTDLSYRYNVPIFELGGVLNGWDYADIDFKEATVSYDKNGITGVFLSFDVYWSGEPADSVVGRYINMRNAEISNEEFEASYYEDFGCYDPYLTAYTIY